METTRPTHIEVADHFYHDSIDLLKRYEHCIESEFPDFSSLKSRRMKCFIDLRMSMESDQAEVKHEFDEVKPQKIMETHEIS